ncbi:hypothetical protein KKC94_01380 [Patescibacteria group bacterium]|nr:hypothetical protein [Patescibacteria group bacterium]
MRTNLWLKEQVLNLLAGPFSDVELKNRISICFGRKAKRRLGSIKMENNGKVSRILINGLFRDESIPEEIILATIAHELCHYAHGFSSPLKRKFRHPHQGGVVTKELKARGLHELHKFEKKWTKANWERVVRDNFSSTQIRRRIVRTRKSPFVQILEGFFNP